MSFMSLLAILSRWLHLVTACIAVGGVFFIRIVLPAALAKLDPEPRQLAFLRARRIFKMIIHTSILLFLITGIFNAVRAFSAYNTQPWQPWMHALLGIHMTLAIAFFAIAIYLFMGATPPASHKCWMTVNLIVLLLAILAASALKWVRERATLTPGPSAQTHTTEINASAAPTLAEPRIFCMMGYN
jgi:uncharacterized membrane protein